MHGLVLTDGDIASRDSEVVYNARVLMKDIAKSHLKLKWVSLILTGREMTHKLAILQVGFLVLSIYSVGSLQSSTAQVQYWQKYTDPGRKFTFLYPPNWIVNKSRNNPGESIDITNPDFNRTKITVRYIVNDNTLQKQFVNPANELEYLEEEIGVDFSSYNSTGKFPHKYTIQGFPTAGDVLEYSIKGRVGKMLNVFAVIHGTDSFLFSYSNSNKLFYKYLPNASQIIKSVIILK